MYLSLPVQLLRSQLANHKGLLAFWLFIYLLVTDNILTGFGGPNLFLEPEYRGEFGVRSMFLLGLAFGLFVFAYQLACFILDGYRFLFIAYLKRPLRVFALNNSLLPVVFVFVYITGFVQFHTKYAEPSGWDVTAWLIALFAGQMLVLAGSTFYFWFLSRGFNRRLTAQLARNLTPGQRLTRRVILVEQQLSKVEWFLTLSLRPRRAVSTIRGSTQYFQRIMARNHGVALLVMLVYLLGLILVGTNYDNPAYHLPAGASMLILFSLLVMVIGALTYWFRVIGLLLAVVVVGGLWWLNTTDEAAGTHPVFGLNYACKPATYSTHRIAQLSHPDTAAADLRQTEAMLTTWLARTQAATGETKPRLVILCTTGGGLRAATWTLTALQALDSATDGRFGQHLRLIAGASGGMMGAAYWRDLRYRRLTEPGFEVPQPSTQRQRMGSDLFNRVVFFGIINVFSPTGRYPYGGKAYVRDRGYAFEEQLVANTDAFRGRRVGDYAPWVARAQLPLMVFTPALVNDGRQLIAADLPAAYLATPDSLIGGYTNEVPAVELRRLLRDQGADSLAFTSLIRMNASFPYVLPFAELPTYPRTEVMDAGVIDNYGVNTAVRWLFRLRGWIDTHTSGVLLVQIRDTPREQANLALARPSPMQRLLSVFGSTYNSLAEARDFANDDLLAYAATFLEVPFEVHDLAYIPQPDFRPAALNFHLIQREKRDIEAAIRNEGNRKVLARIQALLAPGTDPAPTP